MNAEGCHRSKVACCVLLKWNALIVLPPLVHVSPSKNTQLCELSWNDFFSRGYIHVCASSAHRTTILLRRTSSWRDLTTLWQSKCQAVHKTNLKQSCNYPGCQNSSTQNKSNSFTEKLEINKWLFQAINVGDWVRFLWYPKRQSGSEKRDFIFALFCQLLTFWLWIVWL